MSKDDSTVNNNERKASLCMLVSLFSDIYVARYYFKSQIAKILLKSAGIINLIPNTQRIGPSITALGGDPIQLPPGNYCAECA